MKPQDPYQVTMADISRQVAAAQHHKPAEAKSAVAVKAGKGTITLSRSKSMGRQMIQHV